MNEVRTRVLQASLSLLMENHDCRTVLDHRDRLKTCNNTDLILTRLNYIHPFSTALHKCSNLSIPFMTS